MPVIVDQSPEKKIKKKRINQHNKLMHLPQSTTYQGQFPLVCFTEKFKVIIEKCRKRKTSLTRLHNQIQTQVTQELKYDGKTPQHH